MIKEFSKQLLIEAMKQEAIIVLDFYALWCGPCKTFAIEFNKVAEKMHTIATFGKVNIDEHRDLAVQYKVSSIPTVIIIKNGIVAWQHIGTLDANVLEQKIQSVLK
jgi:thioredoxin 1